MLSRKALYIGEPIAGDAWTLYKWTGEKRPPRKGEYYLSGAIIAAYRAYENMNTPQYIARPATRAESHCPCCKRRLPVTA